MSNNRSSSSGGGESIIFAEGRLAVPDNPIIPFIEGDGIGPDIWAATRAVMDAAVSKAYGGRKSVSWIEILAGAKAREQMGSYLPDETVDAISRHLVAIKGPLTTPVGGGFRSLNVALRQKLDLYACVRPNRYLPGVPTPLVEPGLDVIIFRENTEDVYMGLEWQEGSDEARRIIEFINGFQEGPPIAADAGVGIKPISRSRTERLVRKAIRHAIDNNSTSVTLVHKGNIMKYTEGAFRDWGYQLAASEFPDNVISEQALWEAHDGEVPPGMVILKDRIADSMFQQILLRPDEYDVIACPNLNGDYLSDACAAQVGGLGMAPGANLGDTVALFEATHGSAPKYAGQDRVNPGSLILSGVMLLEHLGWKEAGALVHGGMVAAIGKKQVTYDLARKMDGATEVKTSEFARVIIDSMG